MVIQRLEQEVDITDKNLVTFMSNSVVEKLEDGSRRDMTETREAECTKSLRATSQL